MSDDASLGRALALRDAFRFYRVVQVTFLAANVQTEVQHLCGEVPHGVLVINCGGLVKAEPGVQWRKDLAYLRCDTPNAVAVLMFVVLREDPINVNP